MRASLGLLTLLIPFLAIADVVVPVESVETHVNIRMSADAKSEIVGRLRQGDSMPLVQTKDDWHEVEIAEGATGFVSADWSSVITQEPLAQVEEPIENKDDLEKEVISATTIDAADVMAEEVTEEVVETIVEESQNELAQDEVLEEIQIDFDSMKRASESPEILAATDIAVDQPDEIEIPAIVDQAEAAMPIPVVADVGGVGPIGPQGPKGETGPPGPPGAATVEGSVDFLMKFSAPTIGANSQVYDDGINVGINTTDPKQRLDVNGNIQIHDRHSNVAGLMISQADGDTGYIMHNRANTLTIGAGSIDRITIDRDGNIGFSVDRPAHPLQMVSGAYVSAGGVWTNSSSRARKENIAELSPEEALKALAQLQPVEFNYKNDQKEKYVGFIAEDVPELVASDDRKSISTMDIVAVLTKVVQEQQIKIAELEARLDQR